MSRFNFALNYSRVQPSRASRTFVPKRGSNITKIDYNKLNAKQKASASARAKAKSSKRSTAKKRTQVSKKVSNATSKVTKTALEKFEPSSAIRTALRVASRMQLKSPTSNVSHTSGPWVDHTGELGLKFFSSRSTESTKNQLVGQAIGFGNKSKCYKEETILGDPKAMPRLNDALSNKLPLYDTSFRGNGMDDGFYKSQAARKMKAGINMNVNRIFYNPLNEEQIRRLRTSDSDFRSDPFTCVGDTNSTHFDPTSNVQENSVYHPWKTSDKYIFTNLENLTNCKVTIKLIQFVTERNNYTNDPAQILDQMVNKIPTAYKPVEAAYLNTQSLKKYVQPSESGANEPHKSFGEANTDKMGAQDFYTLKGYSIENSKISSQMNVLKTSHRTLTPGESWEYQVENFVNRNIMQSGPISQFPGSRDCIRDTYHVLVTCHGSSVSAYNARPVPETTPPTPWKITERTFLRCNSSVNVGVRQIVEYEDYSFRDAADNRTFPDNEKARLYIKAYRAKPEMPQIHRTIYCLPDNVVTTESVETIPIGNNGKFLIPIATRAEIKNAGMVDAS